ncbi:zinc ribbon domain-containing protein [Methanoregula sp.]|uniref:zinc ribbon domain-containing protein n=2 Tax=Methanoregula sp. TaxID=2052170 RepID=UPI003C754147
MRLGINTRLKNYFVWFDNYFTMKYCSECGKPLASETANFCENCGAKVNNTTPPPQPTVVIIPEEKNPVLAAVCSLLVPGFGQVYDGKMARGFAIFFGTVIGLICLIVPGVIIWLFGVYDAYSIAKKMNNKEIPFLPTKTAHLIIYIVLVVIISVIVFAILALIALASIASHVTPLTPSAIPTITFPTVASPF